MSRLFTKQTDPALAKHQPRKTCKFPQTKLPLPLPGHQVKGPTDASNFDCYSRDLETPPDELSGWDDDF